MATSVPGDRPPVRTCIGCRSRSAKPGMLRLVPVDGRIAADPAARLPGRGAYVCGRASCLDRTLEQDGKRIRRSLRRAAPDATVDDEGIRTAWQQVYGGPTERDPGAEQDNGVAMTSPTVRAWRASPGSVE